MAYVELDPITLKPKQNPAFVYLTRDAARFYGVPYNHPIPTIQKEIRHPDEKGFEIWVNIDKPRSGKIPTSLPGSWYSLDKFKD